MYARSHIRSIFNICLTLSSLVISPFALALQRESVFLPSEVIFNVANSSECFKVITFPAALLAVHLVLEKGSGGATHHHCQTLIEFW